MGMQLPIKGIIHVARICMSDLMNNLIAIFIFRKYKKLCLELRGIGTDVILVVSGEIPDECRNCGSIVVRRLVIACARLLKKIPVRSKWV